MTDTLYALKRMAIGRKLYPAKFQVHALSRTFINNVYRYGRNWELGLVIRYYLRSNIVKLFTITGFGLTMLRRGRLGILPKRVKRANEVRAIIIRANQLGEH